MKVKKINEKIRKIKRTVITTPIMLLIMKAKVFATSTIGAQEVQTATNNIKDAVIKLAMPIRFSAYVCEYSYYCN